MPKFVTVKGKRLKLSDIPKVHFGPSAKGILEGMKRKTIAHGEIVTLGPAARAFLRQKGVRDPGSVFKFVRRRPAE